MIGNLRALMVEKPVVGYSVIGGVLVLAGVVYAMSGEDHAPGRNVTSEWFYNAESKLVSVPTNEISPRTTGEVRAYVYGCPCGDEATQTIAYLEKFSDELAADARAGKPVGIDRGARETFVKEVDGEEWVLLSSDEGRKITSYKLQCAPGVKKQRCFP